MRHEPPFPPFIARALPRHHRDHVLGDLAEDYFAHALPRFGPRGARVWLWIHIVKAIVSNWFSRTRNWNKRTADYRRTERKEMFGTLFSDAAYALRTFKNQPGFTLVILLTLALGIGANTAIFSTVYGSVLRPLPFHDPGRLVWAWGAKSPDVVSNSVAAANFVDYRDQSASFQSMGAYYVFRPQMTVTGGAEAERVRGSIVSEDLFPTLGIDPQLGRHFTADDRRSGVGFVGSVVIISDGYWQRRYGGRDGILGTSLTVDGTPYEIIGVMPTDFDVPRGVDLWVVMSDQAAAVRGSNDFFMIGRLADGVPLTQAQAEVDGIGLQLADAYPETNQGWGLRLVTLHEVMVGNTSAALFILMGAVGLVLLIACGNVASLLLARGNARKAEFAVRTALGGSRTRLINQLLTESTLLAVAGGALGLLLARFGLVALRALGPNIPRLQTVGIDVPTLSFALVASLLTGLLFGIAPALKSTKIDLSQTLKAGGRTASGSSGIRIQGILVAAQFAVSCVLLLGASLLIQSLVKLQNVDPGFDPTNVMTSQIQLSQGSYGTEEQRQQFFATLLDQVRTLPGVEAAGAIDQLPMGGGGTWNYTWAADRPPVSDGDRLRTQRRYATADYFSTMGIPFRSGRPFDNTTRMGNAPVVIINEAMANALWPGEDALGKQVVHTFRDDLHMEVIGVVGDVRQTGLAAPPRPTTYVPYAQFGITSTMQILIRTAGEPLALATALRGIVGDMDSNIPVSQLGTMDQRVTRSAAGAKFMSTLLGIFAAVAVILSSIGLYGTLAYFVSQRSHEMGIRSALGASGRAVVHLVVRKGMRLAAVGWGFGLVAGLASTRVLDSLLFEVNARDPLTFATVAIVLGAVAVAACIIPAVRASRVSLLEVLQSE
jgi:putative ABC transport system permease protein